MRGIFTYPNLAPLFNQTHHIMTTFTTSDRNYETSQYWADFSDIGQFLWESAQSAELDGKQINHLPEEEEFTLGLAFVELVFNGDLGAAYEYAFNLKPYDYKS